MAVLGGAVRNGRGAGVDEGSRTPSVAPDGPPGTAAFAQLYERALPEVYRYLSGRCGAAIAEDLTQDAFVAAAAAIRRGHSDVSLPWLLTIARNKMIDHFRRNDVAARASHVLAASVPDELLAWHGEASRDRAHAALERLSARQRSALVLRYIDGLSVPEVASLIGSSVHATESLLARGRDTFKRFYVEDDDV